MAEQISCPRCKHMVDPQSRFCEQCGVDLALAAIIAEPPFTDQFPFPSGMQIVPEALVPRLGEYLIEKGLLKPNDLNSALAYQKEKAVHGQTVLIGQALLELDMIDRTTLEEAITEQILQLQLALQRSNRQLEQRVAERTSDLQQALIKLAELNQLKANFISNISHELRTPLTHIKGYLDILSDLSLGPLTPLQSDAIKVLMRAEDRLERLIDDLIQFSLSARGELNIQPQSFPIEEMIQFTLSQSWIKAKSKDISLDSFIPAHLPNVFADKEKIAWVLSQLLDNAIKFTPGGGCINIQVTPNGDRLNITVKDNGIGISPERFSEIFEPFHQLDSSVTRRYSGTGLGLAMVKRILEAHGETIQIDSNIGKGSCFEFSLPLTSDYHVG